MHHLKRIFAIGLSALALGACAEAPEPPPRAVGKMVAAPAAEVPDPQSSLVRVPMVGVGGVPTLDVGIAGVCCFSFIIDSGAADVGVTPGLFTAMVNGGYVTRDDLIDVQNYQTASGTSEGVRFYMPPMTIGSVVVRRAIGSVSKDSTLLLLGQTFLKAFKFWAIDNRTGEFVVSY